MSSNATIHQSAQSGLEFNLFIFKKIVIQDFFFVVDFRNEKKSEAWKK